jgi:Ca2+-binding RTX toxin-like protein
VAGETGSYQNFENLSAAGATGALTVTAAAAGGTITTGTGAFADTVTLGAGVDIVNTGDGADTVNGALTLNDTINLAAGADTYAYQATTTGNVVDGGAGSDTITYSGGVKTFTFNTVANNVAGETGSYQNFENLSASGATGA